MQSIGGGGIAVGGAGGAGAVHHSGAGAMRHSAGGGTVGFVPRHEIQTGLYFFLFFFH